MRGLLIKDTCTMIRETKYFLILAVIMTLFQNDFLFSYIIVYAATLPMAALAYDERVKWDKMAETLPLTVDQIVGSKYIMGYLCVAAAMVLAVFGKGIGGAFRMEEFSMMLVVVCVALTVQAFNIPLMFWIGVERGRLLFVLIVVCSAFAASSVWEEIIVNPLTLDLHFILIAAAGITITVNIISFYISGMLYKKEK